MALVRILSRVVIILALIPPNLNICIPGIISGNGIPCSPRDFGFGSVVCVCNMTYCDTVPPHIKLPRGQYAVFLTTKDGDRLAKQIHNFSEAINTTDDIVLSIDQSQSYQTMLGFGGAFTDSAGMTIHSLSLEVQERLLQSYFSVNGIEYNVARIPMASCDFSTRKYSYDDSVDDFELKKFTLAVEDLKFKIPIIRRAMAMTKRPITFFASPWSAPAWMKTNGEMAGKGSLKGKPGGKFYQTWANYFVKFMREYSKYNITFWGVTAQNEPTTGNIANYTFQSMAFTPEMQRDFIVKDLGPTLEKNGYGHIKIMILDDQRLMLPKWADLVLSDQIAAKYVSGIAVHWYLDWLVPAVILNLTHNKYPNKFILATEACEGSMPWQYNKVELGSWSRAENYAHSILQDLLNWVIGWTDWNLALDQGGGPNWAKNFVDSPIIVNAEQEEFYKQPMYYILGHFSKFLPRGSVRVEASFNLEMEELEGAVFITPDKTTVAIILNRLEREMSFHIYDPEIGYINTILPPNSLQTFTWWTQQ